MGKGKLLALVKSLLWGICILLFPIFSGILSAVFSLGTIETLFLQGTFMLLSLIIPLTLVLTGKWKWSEIGFGKFDTVSCKSACYFLPILVVFIPVAVKGFYIKSAPYVLGNLFLYLGVGIAEEVYFRGVIPKYLNREFSLKAVILLCTVIFGVGHITAAFTANNGFEIFLIVLNAFIFGWLAIEMTIIAKNITPVILLHFLFDFETKIVIMSGNGLLAAECVRGALLFIAALWLAIVIKNNPKTKRTLRQHTQL